MSQAKDKVKLLHASDLKNWTRFPEYRDHDGQTLAEYEVQRRAVEAVLSELRDLVRAQDKLAELDVTTPIEYDWQTINIGRSCLPGTREIPLPKPEHPQTTINCDIGEVTGSVLRLPRSWRKRSISASYACPSDVLNADEIAKLKNSLSAAGDEKRARLAEARASHYLQKVLFISHRWESLGHPDPEGTQIAKLRDLDDCFLIYDYSSFPQDTTAPEDEAALMEILSGMNSLIANVLVVSAPDFLKRGWCIYEYIVASMRASIICDELNDPRFVRLRNLSATRPPVSSRLLGSSMESEIQNAKNQQTLETVNSILPLFNRSKFTVERDREIVRSLLVSELLQTLPSKMEYLEYLGEWKSLPWKEEELREAFNSELKWERMQEARNFKPFEPKVPATVADAVRNGYQLDEMPPQNDWTWLTLLDTEPIANFFAEIAVLLLKYGLIAVGVILVVVLVLIFLLVRWIFF